ncbi:unannotated protein [freshwater metagenome]|uniref:Unannotated protein n=1 Tax=freshwater metagenome TaxID=449393 RepID=A0A6J7ANP0_9ZZZZ
MNADERVVHSNAPSCVRTSFSTTTTAALPLSYIATTRSCDVTFALTGIGPCNVIDCDPCTSIAGLKSPMCSNTRDPADMLSTPATTAKVGYTCCAMSMLFSVVKVRSS